MRNRWLNQKKRSKSGSKYDLENEDGTKTDIILDINHLRESIDRWLIQKRNEQRLTESSLKNYALEAESLFCLMKDFLQNKSQLTQWAEFLREYLSQFKPATQWRKLVIWKNISENGPEFLNVFCKSFKGPKLRNRLPHFLDESEFFRLEAVCYKVSPVFRNRLLIALLGGLGLRISEALQLKFKDFSGDWLVLNRKGQKEQRLPVPMSIQTLMKTWRAECLGQDDDWIFCGSLGKPLSSRSAQYLLERLGKLAQLKRKLSPHMLRHTFASHLAEKGANLVALKELLGHQKLSTTERYLHASPEHLRETLQLIHRKNSLDPKN